MRVTGVDWWLDVRRVEKRFRGKVRISVEEAADPLVVDCEALELTSCVWDGEPVHPRVDPRAGTISVAPVSPGPHTLEIEYAGAPDPASLVGLYESPAGPTHVLTTMLFPSGSRRLLPSFEHPAVKTVYRLVLTVDPDDRVIFNTPPLSERPRDGRKEITFAPTPKMSAYLIYLGIGPFDTLTLPGDRWTVTVAASPGRAAAGRFCGERAMEILAAYESYYGRPYPLPKLDLIGLENFWAGAMENWGAISFRDSLLLVDATASERVRRAALAVLAHEIAHQWFGDLVTAAWWDDFWLNESFATFVGYRIIDRCYPDAEPWTDMLVNWVGPALLLDSLDATHPVHVPVVSPAELGENADAVTYGKGAAILRMIESYLGEETFRRGISEYLARFQYANARSEDLWASLSEVARQPVGRILQEWIGRPGYPVVHVRRENGELRFRQERFRADGRPASETWPIPFRLRVAGEERRLLFEGPELRVPTGDGPGLRVDPGRNAFVRIHYEDGLSEAMRGEFGSMDPRDQWGMLGDAAAFLTAGTIRLPEFLALVERADQLTDGLPIRNLIRVLGELDLPLHDIAPFAAARQRFLESQLRRVGREGTPGEPDGHPLLREILLFDLVDLDVDLARELAPRFDRFDELAPELRISVAGAVARVGGPGAFDRLLQRMQRAPTATERTQMLHALGLLDSAADLRRALDLVSSRAVPPGQGYEILGGLCGTPRAATPLWEWYRTHSEELAVAWAGTPLHSGFLSAGGLRSMGIDREAEVRAFFAAHTPSDAASGAARGLESLRLAMQLRDSVRGTPPEGPATGRPP